MTSPRIGEKGRGGRRRTFVSLSPTGLSGVAFGVVAGGALGGPVGALVGAALGGVAGEALEYAVPSKSAIPPKNGSTQHA